MVTILLAFATKIPYVPYIYGFLKRTSKLLLSVRYTSCVVLKLVVMGSTYSTTLLPMPQITFECGLRANSSCECYLPPNCYATTDLKKIMLIPL
jgi:hypothetical protein